MARARHVSVRQPIVVVVVLWALALICTACGSEIPADDPIAASIDRPLATELSPLEQRLGFSSDETKRQRQQIDLQRQAEEQVAVCMTNKGFDYVPAAIDETFLTGEVTDDGSRLWAEHNGLGITAAFVAAREAIERQTGQVDHNAAYLASLSQADAEAWVNALSGQAPEDAEGSRLAYEPGGCLGSAFASVYAQFDVLDQVADKLESLNARMQSDPRVGGFVADWSICMAGLGHQYRDQDQMVDDVYARLLNIGAFTDEQTPLAESSTEVSALLEFERALAVASFDCSRSFADGLIQIRAAYESEFIEDNRQLIDALSGKN